jgi:hypothetical protein
MVTQTSTTNWSHLTMATFTPTFSLGFIFSPLITLFQTGQ